MSVWRVKLALNLRSYTTVFNHCNSGSIGKVKPFKDIPGPTRIPIWGNLYLYKIGKFRVDKYHKVQEELYRRYGPLVRQDIGSETLVHVFHPEDAKTVYGNEDSTPYASPLQVTTQLYRKSKNMSPGLGNVNGEEWYRLRSAVRQMMLRPKEVYHYLPLIQQVAQDFVQHLEQIRDKNEEVHNLREQIAKWNLESSGIVCFETRLGAFDGKEKEIKCQKLIEANKKIFQLSSLLKFSLPIYKYVSTPKWNQLMAADDVVYKTSGDFFKNTVKLIKNISEEELANGKYNFLAFLLSKKELSMNDRSVITFSLFTDGLSTTVVNVLFNLYCLAINPRVQEKVYQEVSRVLKNEDAITVDTINNLQYLKAVVKETFRMYPNGTEVSRITKRDMLLSGYEIPTGTHVNLTPNVYFRSKEYFEDPDEFLPERWLRGKEDLKDIHPFLLTPFSHGSRTCAGRRFAEQDMYVLLSLILKKFHLSYLGDKSRPMEQLYHTLLIPDGPMRLKFTKRN